MKDSKVISPQFSPGDVVSLKSGSVPMTVEMNYQPKPNLPIVVWCVYHINGTDYARHQYRQVLSHT